MTDSDGALEEIARAASDLVPQLTERLARHGLGEVEVSDGGLRLRVRSGVAPTEAASDAAIADADQPTSADVNVRDAADAGVPVGSPAVGFFVFADGLGPGLEVGKGDSLGHVEMLGVRHEVRAPRGGTVRSLVAESGEAVEYGQVVIELEPTVPAR
jgi:acetyl-CoA carboxylase biotin carboxyl carrier protein